VASASASRIAAFASGAGIVVHPGATNHEVDHSALPWGHVLLPNEREAPALLEISEPADRDTWKGLPQDVARRTGVPTVVVTLGEDGCAVESPHLSAHFPAIAKARVAATMGASDNFTATLALQLAVGTSLAESVHEAQRAAAWAIGRAGGHEATPRK
jgi:sugar/nucleoside kinase (ribokinase family)